ncbi:MAG TPA: 2-oxo-4-hydroxy-4-carboxy-5-ureidoimidazoline decarboxylase [Candidatus Limnocylindrales bacterium]|nr:2-oxo-4-hydroxy-4-carboxy-5-ureidoimidazoline decarboxylase [Candidatus Limnocylindrales bacterium]
MTVTEVNRATPQAFTAALAGVFENSPWVPERAAALRPFHDVEGLHAALSHEVEIAGEEEQLALLNAHPELGARSAMTPLSQAEQSGAGIQSLPADRLETLREFNAEYRRRNGFPFICAVRGLSGEDILFNLETRLHHTRDEEFNEALEQVSRIAWLRLNDIVESA